MTRIPAFTSSINDVDTPKPNTSSPKSYSKMTCTEILEARKARAARKTATLTNKENETWNIETKLGTARKIRLQDGSIIIKLVGFCSPSIFLGASCNMSCNMNGYLLQDNLRLNSKTTKELALKALSNSGLIN